MQDYSVYEFILPQDYKPMELSANECDVIGLFGLIQFPIILCRIICLLLAYGYSYILCTVCAEIIIDITH